MELTKSEVTQKSNMQPYHDVIAAALANGHKLLNQRTGEVCHYLFGQHLVFNLSEGFPAPTSKKFFMKSCVGELLGFFRGYTSAADFRAVGTKVWDANANQTTAWLANPYRKGEDSVGNIYGVQYTRWKDSRIADTEAERDRLLGLGYAVEMEGKDGRFAMVRYINQLENLLRTLLTDPSDRRMIVSAWNVAELDMMCLVPCHHTYTFVANPDGTLDLECAIRSWDSVLAFNVQLTAIFVSIVAKMVGRTPGMVVLNAANAHVYDSHKEAAELMLSREHFKAPTLMLSDNIKPVTLETIRGAFERINPEDIWLEGYESHEAIKVKMAT